MNKNFCFFFFYWDFLRGEKPLWALKIVPHPIIKKKKNPSFLAHFFAPRGLVGVNFFNRIPFRFDCFFYLFPTNVL